MQVVAVCTLELSDASRDLPEARRGATGPGVGAKAEGLVRAGDKRGHPTSR